MIKKEIQKTELRQTEGKKVHIIEKIFFPPQKPKGLVLVNSWPIIDPSFTEPKRSNSCIKARFIHYVFGPPTEEDEE